MPSEAMTLDELVAKATSGPWAVEDPFDFELSIIAEGEKGPAEWAFVAACHWPDEDLHGVTSRQVKANAELICRLRTIADRLTGEDAVEKLAEQIDGYFDGPPAFLREAASAILIYLTEGVKP